METYLPIIRAAFGLVAGGSILAFALSRRHRGTAVHDLGLSTRRTAPPSAETPSPAHH